MKKVVSLNVNGLCYEIAAEPNAILADVLREQFRLTGVKKGCDDGDCGACSVLCDGKVIPSCTTLACEVEGTRIVTIEGVRQGDNLHPVQQAFVDCFAIQCGFCTPGMVIATIALLNENPDPTEEEIRGYLRGNICRCTGYTKIIDAVNQAKETLKGQEGAK
jgi:carbon-monoxide dehydrogenase small subunit